MDELKEIAKAFSDNKELLRLIYSDLAQPGVQQMGKAIGTLLGLGNTVLLPVKLLNERANVCFRANMEKYRNRLKDVPEDEIQEVAPEIGVPILDRLTYVNDEVLAEMFVSLLAKASTTKNADEAHPAFISIIDNLCPDEALLIKGLGFGNEIYGNFAFSPPNNSNEPLSKRLYFNEVPFLLDPSTINRVNLQYPEYGAAYIHNLKRLGLIETFLLNPEKEINKGYAEYYERIKEYYNEFLKKHPLFYDHAEVTWYFGKINFTPFGNFFKHTCNLGT